MRTSNKDKYIKCARCHKLLYRINAFWIKGLPYGPECAEIVLADLLERRTDNGTKGKEIETSSEDA